MSQQEKARYFNLLKAEGVEFTKHYRDYKTEELKKAWERLEEATPPGEPPEPHLPPPAPASPVLEDMPPEGPGEPAADPLSDAALDELANLVRSAVAGEPEPQPQGLPPVDNAMNQHRAAQQVQPVRVSPQPTERIEQPSNARPVPPTKQRDPDELAGQRLNSQPYDEPIRIDPETGFAWYQEEVLKPAYPKPRGRRVLDYQDTGVEVQKMQAGQYNESFEVAGHQPPVAAQIKITLPSYQVGLYKDRRFPFKIHIYNGNRGFNLFDVQNFYGGSELVPQEIKRIYVSNVLCYDIRTTIRAITTEYRQLQLERKI